MTIIGRHSPIPTHGVGNPVHSCVTITRGHPTAHCVVLCLTTICICPYTLRRRPPTSRMHRLRPVVSDASTRREWAEGAEAEEREEDVELRRCILCTREQGCNISMSCNFCQLLRREIVRVLRQESVTRDLLYAS